MTNASPLRLLISSPFRAGGILLVTSKMLPRRVVVVALEPCGYARRSKAGDTAQNAFAPDALRSPSVSRVRQGALLGVFVRAANLGGVENSGFFLFRRERGRTTTRTRQTASAYDARSGDANRELYGIQGG